MTVTEEQAQQAQDIILDCLKQHHTVYPSKGGVHPSKRRGPKGGAPTIQAFTSISYVPLSEADQLYSAFLCPRSGPCRGK